MRTESEQLGDFENAVGMAAGSLAAALLLGEELGLTPSRVVAEIQERATELESRFNSSRQERLPVGGGPDEK